MSSHIEHQMESYLNEMERLQNKMMELQKTKEKEDQENKVNDIEPNILVLKSWIDEIKTKNKFLADKDAEEKYNNKFKTKRVLEKKKLTDSDEYKDLVKLINSRMKLWNEAKKPTKLFHNKVYGEPDTPSQFMIDYIEATYNLFQIQQKRIEELENVVAELNAEIE